MKKRLDLLLSANVESRLANLNELKILHVKHYDEISQHKEHGIPLNPSDDEYRHREECGQLIHIALRNRGKIVGYLDGFVRSSLHYIDCLTYVMDIIYVEKECRGRNGDGLMIERLLSECKRRGVKHVMLGYKNAHKQFLPKKYAEYGFKPFDHIMALWI